MGIGVWVGLVVCPDGGGVCRRTRTWKTKG